MELDTSSKKYTYRGKSSETTRNIRDRYIGTCSWVGAYRTVVCILYG